MGIQGHAVWHILGAVAAWYLLLHFHELERQRTTPLMRAEEPKW
jgi:hypothetical protein